MASDDKKASPSTDSASSKSESTSDAGSSNYSRGENQKPVSKAYKDNWNAIFGNKSKR